MLSPSVIRSFVAVLSAVSFAAAQVPLGVEMVPNPDIPSISPDPSYPSNSDSSWSSTLPVETGSPVYGAPPSLHTPPPPESSIIHEPMPYSSFVDGGYSKMDCGYGFKKGADGKCAPEGWWNDSWGCYQTTIIINKGNPHQSCPPHVTVTDKSVETKILTVTYTQHIPTTITDTVTKTDVKTETLHVTKTETLPHTITATSILVESKILTKTDTIKEIHTDVVTKTDTHILPTTYTSIWVKTDVVDKTHTIEHTLTSTVVDKKTLTDTTTYISTSTKTDTSTHLSVATSTTTHVLKETGLSECLSQCDQYKHLKPGNDDKWNTYASPPAHTPSPTYQPYQDQYQGGGKY